MQYFQSAILLVSTKRDRKKSLTMPSLSEFLLVIHGNAFWTAVNSKPTANTLSKIQERIENFRAQAIPYFAHF
jgi:hypothetical protein